MRAAIRGRRRKPARYWCIFNHRLQGVRWYGNFREGYCRTCECRRLAWRGKSTKAALAKRAAAR